MSTNKRVGVSGLSSKNIIPEYMREYQFIKLMNKKVKYFIDNHDNINNGLFTNPKVDEIRILLKRFFRRRKEGKFKNISNLKLDNKEYDNLLEVQNNFRMFKYRHDVVPYPGFDNIYYDFESFFSLLKIKSIYESFYEENSDSEYDSDYDIQCLGYESDGEIFIYSESESESESDSDIDSDKDYVYI